MQEVLQAVNAGATSLNSNTLANVNAMNVELHNADGSLAGKYTLSNFLENVIYQFLATTKASALASVLGVPHIAGTIPNEEKIASGADLNNLTTLSCYRCNSAAIAATVQNVPQDFYTGLGFVLLNVQPYGGKANSQQILIQDTRIYIRTCQYNSSTATTEWNSWSKVSMVS